MPKFIDWKAIFPKIRIETREEKVKWKKPFYVESTRIKPEKQDRFDIPIRKELLNNLPRRANMFFNKSWTHVKKRIESPEDIPINELAKFIWYFTLYENVELQCNRKHIHIKNKCFKVDKVKSYVLDPFCDDGKILETCERTGRFGIGIDVNPKKIMQLKKKRFKNQSLICGNSIELLNLLKKNDYELTNKIAYCFTILPLKLQINGTIKDVRKQSDFDEYMSIIRKIFSQVLQLISPGRYITLIIPSLLIQKKNTHLTNLAWEIDRTLAKIGWIQCDEKILCFNGKSNNDVFHYYFLQFLKPGERLHFAQRSLQEF